MTRLLEKATRQHTKDHNSRLVLRTIYDADEISRADLARLTRLTRTTVSDVVTDLIAQRLVEEVGNGPSGVGRTATLLSVVDESRHIIAVNITNTKVEGALLNLRGTIRRQAELPLARQDSDAVLALVFPLIDSLINAASQPLLGIGISSPGLIDTVSGIVQRAVNFNWRNLPLRDIVQARYNLPVYVANDSSMVVLAEYLFGPKEKSSNLVVIKVGTGIGAGILLNGQLLANTTFGAGEIGHVVVEKDGLPCKCGNIGCLETVANIPALVRRAEVLAHNDPHSQLHRLSLDGVPITIDTVVHAFSAGDQAVHQAIMEIGYYLSAMVATLIAILGIQRVIVTGRVAPFGDVLRDAILHEVRQRVLPDLAEIVEIEVVAQEPNTIFLGAAALLLTNELGLARLVQRQRQKPSSQFNHQSNVLH